MNFSNYQNDGILYTRDFSILISYPKGLKNETFEVPEPVQTIGMHAFHNCTNLTTFIIGKNVKNIEEAAFDSCINLNCIYYLGKSEPSFGETSFRKVKAMFILVQASYQNKTFGNLNVEKGATIDLCPNIIRTKIRNMWLKIAIIIGLVLLVFSIILIITFAVMRKRKKFTYQ